MVLRLGGAFPHLLWAQGIDPDFFWVGFSLAICWIFLFVFGSFNIGSFS